MLKETIADAKEIITNVLNEPLSVANKEEEVSLLQAAENFDPQNANSSDLCKIMYNFLHYPEATEMLTTEFQLLINEIDRQVNQ